MKALSVRGTRWLSESAGPPCSWGAPLPPASLTAPAPRWQVRAFLLDTQSLNAASSWSPTHFPESNHSAPWNWSF